MAERVSWVLATTMHAPASDLMVLDNTYHSAGCGRSSHMKGKGGMSHQRHSMSVMCQGVILVGFSLRVAVLPAFILTKSEEN